MMIDIDECKVAWKMRSFFEKWMFCAHFHLSYLFNFSFVRRQLFKSRVFIIFIFETSLSGSYNIYARTTYLHVIQGWTYFKFELIPSSLDRRHQLCIYGKIVGQMPLILNPATIFFFFVKTTSSHASDVI